MAAPRLDIHSHEIHQTFPAEVPQQIRLVAVGVQLHQKSQLPYAADEILQIRLQRGLTSGDAHPLQNALPFSQKVQHLPGPVLRLHRSRQQLAVVAERAAEIAASRKDRGGHMAWEIQQRRFL